MIKESIPLNRKSLVAFTARLCWLLIEKSALLFFIRQNLNYFFVVDAFFRLERRSYIAYRCKEAICTFALLFVLQSTLFKWRSSEVCLVNLRSHLLH